MYASGYKLSACNLEKSDLGENFMEFSWFRLSNGDELYLQEFSLSFKYNNILIILGDIYFNTFSY